MSGDAPAEPGRELAASVTTLLAADGSAIGAVQAAQRIRAWHDTMRTLSAIARTQIMESCWAIRRARPDRAAFDAFVVEQVTEEVLTADRAWLLAETWEEARHARPLRALASHRPDDAVAFVNDFVETACTERLKTLHEDEREYVALLALPSKQRRAKLRALREIREPLPDARAGEDAPERPVPVSDRVRVQAVVERLRECETQLAAVADDLGRLAAADLVPPAKGEQVTRIADFAMSHLERIAELSMSRP